MLVAVSFDLYGVGGRHARFLDGEWIKLLELGREYGWEPAGTRAPLNWCAGDGNAGANAAWYAGYECNSGQAVTSGDARRLGRAILRGLPDVPDVGVAETLREYEFPEGDDCADVAEDLHPRLRRVLRCTVEALRGSGLASAPGAKLVGPDLSLRPVEFLGGEKDRVRAFARLALAGGFVIL